MEKTSSINTISNTDQAVNGLVDNEARAKRLRSQVAYMNAEIALCDHLLKAMTQLKCLNDL